MGRRAQQKRQAKQKTQVKRVVDLGASNKRFGGWPQEQVRSRHMKLATSLMQRGVDFQAMTNEHFPEAESLVRANILGSETFTINPEAGGMVATDKDGNIIGVAVVSAGVDKAQTMWLSLTHLVVVTSWRGQGVGTVMVNLIHQLVPTQYGTAYLTGACSEEGREFYHRAGFEVLDEDEPLFIPFGNRAAIVNSNRNYPYQFKKTLKIA